MKEKTGECIKRRRKRKVKAVIVELSSDCMERSQKKGKKRVIKDTGLKIKYRKDNEWSQNGKRRDK